MLRASWIALTGIGLSVFAANGHADTDPLLVDYPSNGVSLGSAWNMTKMSPIRKSCIEFSSRPAGPVAQENVLYVNRVMDQESLSREIEVSASIKASALGGASGSAKTTFSRKVEIKREDLNLVATARVAREPEFVDNPPDGGGVRLKNDMLALAQSNLGQFFLECGNAYVSAMHGGAEIRGLIKVHIESRREQEAVSGAIEGSYGTVAGAASLKQKLDHLRKRTEYSMVYYKAGGNGEPLPTNEKELLESISSLPGEAQRAPKWWSVSLSRYDQLPNWPRDRSTRWTAPDVSDLVIQYDRLEAISKELQFMTTKANLGKFVLGFNASEQSLNELSDQIRGKMRKLVARLEQCMQEKPDRCLADADVMVPDYEYRTQLPVQVDSFAEDTRLRRLRSKRARAMKEIASVMVDLGYKATDVDIPAKVKEATTRAATNKPVTDFTKIKRAVAERQKIDKALAKAESEYPAALQLAIFEQWIEDASNFRCEFDVLDDACLSAADKQSYNTKIGTLVRVRK